MAGERVVRIIYNILFTIFFILASPYYFLRLHRRGNWQKNFSQRFGAYDSKIKQSITNRHVLWIHAVSVGEVNVCLQLIRALEPRLPNVKIVVSTTTTTGMALLQEKLPNHIGRIYYPIDYRKYVARALGVMHPEAVILVEAEIWPNFIWRLRDKGVPVFLVNARVSERSFRRYRRLGFLFRPLFACFKAVGAQNQADAGRLAELGCRKDAVYLTGSLKFDAAKPDDRKTLDVGAILRRAGAKPQAKILVAGSTHDGEEVLLADMAARLRSKFPDLFLVLVPRHFERCKDLSAELRGRGVRFSLRSEIDSAASLKPGEADCLLVNTTGELKFFYECATVVFVGKSLTAEGGQNPIEPGALGRAMVFGPNMQNFADVVRIFLSRDAAIQVNDAAELEETLSALLENSSRREQLGQNALGVVRENLGAVERTVGMILEHLDGTELYIARGG